MIEIEIDGKKVEVEPGAMIIEVADKSGIPIPRFCYHKKLSIAANCRMCLVEVEKAPKPLPACATPVTAGMKVFTQSAKAKEAQRSVMEFLLINHPLDCPICDQGGECELQDVSLVYGSDISRFTEGKRSVKDDDLGPLVETEMTRCIQCTRCVRFGQEISGIRELGAVGRGENMQISTYVKHSMTSELSGNIIDLCPVGALTSKPYRFTARAWELEQNISIAPHDCIGSHIYIHTLRNKVMRAVPRENEALNETWISDRDRFAYTGLHEDRLLNPMVKVNGEWCEVDWNTAIADATSGLNKIKEQYGAEQIAALASPSATTEEHYLLQKLLRELGSNNIDHRLHQTDFSDQEISPLFPALDISLAELEAQNIIILLGSNISREQPIAAHRVRKATLRGAKVISINVCDYAVNFNQQERIVVAPNRLTQTLIKLIKVLHENNPSITLSDGLFALLQKAQYGEVEKKIVATLMNEKNAIILLGAIAQNHPQAAMLRSLAQTISQFTGAKIGCLTEGSNSAGAWLAGAVPHRTAAGVVATKSGLSAHAAIKAKLKSYLLLNVEPELDCAHSALAKQAMHDAELVIAFSPFKSKALLEHADILLPIAAFSETPGTFVNVNGHWQTFVAAAKPLGEARPAWKVLRVLANHLHIAGFEYESVENVHHELKKLVDAAQPIDNKAWQFSVEPHTVSEDPSAQNIQRITEWPIYAVDSLVRRAIPLQESASNDPIAVYINPELAKNLNLREGQMVNVIQDQNSVQLQLTISPRVPDYCALIHAGREETVGLGSTFGKVEIIPL